MLSFLCVCVRVRGGGGAGGEFDDNCGVASRGGWGGGDARASGRVAPLSL